MITVIMCMGSLNVSAADSNLAENVGFPFDRCEIGGIVLLYNSNGLA